MGAGPEGAGPVRTLGLGVGGDLAFPIGPSVTVSLPPLGARFRHFFIPSEQAFSRRVQFLTPHGR